MEDDVDIIDLMIAAARAEKAPRSSTTSRARDQRRMFFPSLVAAEEEIAVVALEVAAFADFEDDVEILEFHRSTFWGKLAE